MAIRPFRIYSGPQSFDRASSAGQHVDVLAPAAPATVKVTLGEVLPILADAVASRRTWVSDFAADEIEISADLHDVLQAYRHFRRPGA